MGENFVQASERLALRGSRAFCLEGVYTKDAKFITFEFSQELLPNQSVCVRFSVFRVPISKWHEYGKKNCIGNKNAISKRKLDKSIT